MADLSTNIKGTCYLQSLVERLKRLGAWYPQVMSRRQACWSGAPGYGDRQNRDSHMPTLEFKGKPFVYSHHLSVPFRELIVDAKKSYPGGKKASLDDNLIIHGDNLEALKALLPRYAGKVDVIYIDPPYNTGTESCATTTTSTRR
jgi:hypothetical protein